MRCHEVRRRTMPGRYFSGLTPHQEITTASGSTGYYSYLDKLDRGDHLQPEKFTKITEDEVGICHIAPTYTSRSDSPFHPLRYSVPWGTSFKITLMRDADAHLFGVTQSRKGLRITTKDVVEVGPSRNTTNVIRLASRHHPQAPDMLDRRPTPSSRAGRPSAPG